MHPAWQIHEIRVLIFEHTRPEDLARLARTNKTLFEIATDKLWSKLDTVEAFVCCLPSHFTSQKLEVEDLARLDFYARKVKGIVLESTSGSAPVQLPRPFRMRRQGQDSKQQRKQLYYWSNRRVEEISLHESWIDLWSQIGQLRPRHEFLPNLRSIRVNHALELLFCPLVGIAGTHLTSIYIKIIHERQANSVVKQFLEQIQDVSSLEYLFVRDGEPDIVPTSILKKTKLKHLRLDPRGVRRHDEVVDPYPLRREILDQDRLEHLTLGLTRDWYPFSIMSPRRKYLPALKTIWLNLRHLHQEDPHQRGRKPPAVFFEGLDNPALELINIKFLWSVSGKDVMDIIQAVSKHCRLDNLAELVLSRGGWIPHCDECGAMPPPVLGPDDLKATMRLLLPLPRLRVLRLTVVPNMLTAHDDDFFEVMAEGLPSLQTVSFGSSTFATGDLFTGNHFYERMTLKTAAIFCRLFPRLSDVQLGCVDLTVLEEKPDPAWTCLQVTQLRVDRWIDAKLANRRVQISKARFLQALHTYFPNSDMAKADFDGMYMFEPSNY